MDFFVSMIYPAIAISVILFYYLRWRKQETYRALQAPEAAGAWPVIGHLHLFAGSQPAHKTLTKLADKHGAIFTIRTGVHRALVVSSSEIARECLTTNDKVFASRPKYLASEVLTYNYAIFALTQYGPYWRQSRKIAVLKLLSNNQLENLRPVMESEVKTAMKELYELWDDNKEVSHAVGMEMKKWFSDIALNNVFRIVVGKRYAEAMSGSDSGSCVGDIEDRYRKALQDFLKYLGRFVVSDAIPWLRWLDLGGHERAMKETAIVLDGMAERWLGEHKRSRASASDCNDRDFISVMLSILDSPEFDNSNYDADTISKASAMASSTQTMILAASDTTRVAMTWALALLLNNREALKKAQHELDKHVGRERPVEEADLKNLVYLRAVLKETLRLYPPVPLSVPHESMEDCTVAGYHVPAGTRLIVNCSKIHRDPRVWPNPDKFRPERFLSGEAQSIDVRGQSFELLPFSSGRRMCPGVSFAFLIIELSLASFIQGFEITTPFNEPVDMSESVGMTNLKASPLDVLIIPRLPAEAY